MKFLKNVNKDELMASFTRTVAKCGYKLKKASPTIMIVGAAVGGIAATVLACKATIKAQDILAEHNEAVKNIHVVKTQIENGEMELKDGEAYTEEDLKKDITRTYVQTGLKLAKVYAPAVTLGTASLVSMFGSHRIMTRRNASLTAAYIALDHAFDEYKTRVANRFGSRVQEELERNIKAAEVESKKTNENGIEETVKEYKDVALDATDPYSLVFDETVYSWDRDPMLNQVKLNQAELAANRRLRTNGHLFLNEVIDIIDPCGHGAHHTPIGQVVGWVYDPAKCNGVDFGITAYKPDNVQLSNFMDGDEPSVILHFNCDGPIIDKI